MRVKLATVLFVIFAASLALFPIEAFKVTGLSASVSEPEFSGRCPHRFIFTGRITTNREGTVRYRWLRSDGSAGLEETLAFAAAGTKTVSSYWEVGGGMGRQPDRWMRIEIVAPNSLLSNKAVFEQECIPQLRVERKFYTISGRLLSYAGQAPFLEVLEGAQLKVHVVSGGRTVKDQLVTLTAGGNDSYSVVLINAPGSYLVSVEPASLPERMIWQRADPVSIAVTLTEASPRSINNNFTYYYALSGML